MASAVPSGKIICSVAACRDTRILAGCDLVSGHISVSLHRCVFFCVNCVACDISACFHVRVLTGRDRTVGNVSPGLHIGIAFNRMPDKTEIIPEGWEADMASNHFAVCDVNGDGHRELLISIMLSSQLLIVLLG